SSATQPWAMRSWIASFTTLTAYNLPEKACENRPPASKLLTQTQTPEPITMSVEAAAHDRVKYLLTIKRNKRSPSREIAAHNPRNAQPGYAASHGCVRMPFGFAENLFDKTWIGMRVIISPNDAAPVEFSHPALFVPNAEAVAAAPARAEMLAREAEEAAKTADEAKKAAATAARATASLTASVRKLEWLKRSADAGLAFSDKMLAAAKTDQAKAQAE